MRSEARKAPEWLLNLELRQQTGAPPGTRTPNPRIKSSVAGVRLTRGQLICACAPTIRGFESVADRVISHSALPKRLPSLSRAAADRVFVKSALEAEAGVRAQGSR